MISAYFYLASVTLSNLLSNFGVTCSSETGVNCDAGLPKPGGGDVGTNQLTSILGFVFAILGALSVLFIVLGAFRMVTAQGDSQQVSKARSTIIYALVGLVVALLAEAFVAFVLDKLA